MNALRKKVIGIVIAIVFVISLFLLFHFHSQKEFTLSNNLLHYSESNDVHFVLIEGNKTENYTIYYLNYTTKENSVPAIIYEPNLIQEKYSKKYPAVLILPGATVTKEGMHNRLQLLANLGYVAMTIDTRATGENKAQMNSFQYDYQLFAEGKETTQYLQISEALQAIALLKKLDFVDQTKIIIAGESMGGRIATITGYNDQSIKGFLIISSSGYQTILLQDSAEKKFYLTIDPDNYFDKLNGRRIVFIHSTKDTTIPIKSAQASFAIAKEPKKFIAVDYCNHGYCGEMDGVIQESLDWLEG